MNAHIMPKSTVIYVFGKFKWMREKMDEDIRGEILFWEMTTEREMTLSRSKRQ